MNLMPNGACQVWQRGTSFSNITNGIVVVHADRILDTCGGGNGQVFKIERSTDVPANSGLPFSEKWTVTSAAATVAAGPNRVNVRWLGNEVQELRKGTTAAQQLTIQFWMKCSLTGDLVLSVTDPVNQRSVGHKFNYPTANTWQQVTHTFPADTSGVIPNNSQHGLYMLIYLSAGSSFTSGTLQTTWANSVTADRGVGQTVDLGANVNATFLWTGIGVYVGSTAPAFEIPDFNETLHRCQVHYQKSYNQGSGPGTNTMAGAVIFNPQSTGGRWPVQFHRPMAASPTVASYSTTGAKNKYRNVSTSTDVTATPTDIGQGGFSNSLAVSGAAGHQKAFHWAAETGI